MDKVALTKDLENKKFTVVRTFDAPKSKVWRAYSDKGWFAKWWGPEGWQTTLKDFNFAPGGRVHYCMKCVDPNQGEFFGQESWGIMDFTEVNEADYGFTYKDYFADAEGNIQDGMPAITMYVDLVEEDERKTKVVVRCQAESAEDIEKLIAMGMVEGYSSSTNKLERLLAEAE